ncbi:MAG TPA: M20/M25/M40 family metallo-hydrolase [Planctomycetota bacterium]|nr:M20/M25/M40 family metallo-hydrolase [Planctomycetota bacterium]
MKRSSTSRSDVASFGASLEPPIDRERALAHLLDLLAIEGLSGREGRVASAVREKLLRAGCRESWIAHDKAHRKIGRDFEIGNLIVKIPGRRGASRRLFMGHLDTVPLCRGAEPVRRGDRIVPKGKTALGADNRTAVACIVTMIEHVLANELDHPPLTLLFTVGEEIGLLGASAVETRDLGDPELGFNYDANDPQRIGIGAIGADRFQVEVLGRSSHAGVHPEDGVSAILIAARAIEDAARRGLFGRIRQGAREGAANIGRIAGGEATNQVTDRVVLAGEARSHRKAFLEKITSEWRRAFERAAKSVKNASGVHGEVRFTAERSYDAFKLSERAPIVRLVSEQIRALGGTPTLHVSNGGLDASPLNAKGVPTVTLGAGQHHPHTVDEYVDIEEYLGGCRLAVALATS